MALALKELTLGHLVHIVENIKNLDIFKLLSQDKFHSLELEDEVK